MIACTAYVVDLIYLGLKRTAAYMGRRSLQVWCCATNPSERLFPLMWRIRSPGPTRVHSMQSVVIVAARPAPAPGPGLLSVMGTARALSIEPALCH